MARPYCQAARDTLFGQQFWHDLKELQVTKATELVIAVFFCQRWREMFVERSHNPAVFGSFKMSLQGKKLPLDSISLPQGAKYLEFTLHEEK